MFIKSIVLEGFKSYGNRTVIEGFDREFNAITGLNGTGKSNILDSICFVLGISQLSNVRVTSLQDLVYKSGQAGITKATVSITFDNRDKNNSPVGFEDYREITVTRQVVMGGKNKYLINGANVQNKRVQDLFCSVQLNVNNPHFLIMQGRIVKVLNMKPPEILSMVEEAVGTRMYEVKKLAAEKSIAKKDAKLKEINDLTNEEIMPKLNKLREERNLYKEFLRLERELENLSALLLAWQFIQSKRAMKDSIDTLNKKEEEINQIENNIAKNKQRVEDIDTEIAEQQKDSQSREELQNFEADVKEKEKILAHANAAEKAAKHSVTAEESKMKLLLSNLKDDEAVLSKKETESNNLSEMFQSLKDTEAADKAAFLAAQKKFEAVNAGMEIDDDGQAVTLQEQLIKTKQEATEAATAVKDATMRLQHNESQLKEIQKNMDTSVTDYKKDKALMENLNKDLQNFTKQLEHLNYDESKVHILQDSKRKLTYEIREIRNKMERFEAKYPQSDFQYKDPESNFNRNSVKGLVFKLMSLKNLTFATALETAAGARLFNVITDTEVTGKKLLQSGQLQRRTTFIPLNKIKGNPVSSSVLKYAQSIVGENNVHSALQLIEFNNELKPAMEFIFGSVLICRDINTARKVAFNDKILRKCVTLEGDVVDPAGILSGGANAPGGSFLVQHEEYRELQAQISAKEQELTKLEAQIQNLQRIAKKYEEVKDKHDITSHQYSVIQSRLQQNSYYQQQEEIDKLKKAIVEFSESIKVNKKKETSCLALAKKIEDDIKNSKNNKDQKIMKVENEMKQLKKKFENSKNIWKDKEQVWETLKLEIAELKSAITTGHEQIKLCEENIIALKKQVEESVLTASKAKEIASKLQAEYKEKKQLVSSKNKEVQKKLKEKSDLLAQISELELQIKKESHEITELREKCNNFKSKENKFKQQIKENDARLKDAELLTENEGHELIKKVTKAQEQKNKLSRTVNVKAQSMFEQEEKQHQMLLKKKNVVETERQKLFNFMLDIDQKKISFLKTATEQISKDFGSIFGTILPGTNARLSPPEGKTVLDGLEIKVSIGGIWKDNLGELSGGQKSLIALSLILAMLLFKPAPIYILDEVDAALDLSHTQNIGKMLSKHFRQSQFIIVSLKDGMFNNANVLFRTKFVDGMSTVTKTVNENIHKD